MKAFEKCKGKYIYICINDLVFSTIPLLYEFQFLLCLSNLGNIFAQVLPL